MALSKEALAVVAAINKTHGDGTVVLADEIRRMPPFTSGSLAVDAMLAGGFPANQWTEIIGKQSVGKTSFVHKVVAANQAVNPDFTTYWVAGEDYEPDWAALLGVDVSRVVRHKTGVMEEAYEAILTAVESKAFDCVVLDSYPALSSEEELKKGMDESTMAIGAKLTGRLFRKMNRAAHRSLTEKERPFFGLFINQWRQQIGGWAPAGVTPQFTPGGAAKDYAFYVRLELKAKEQITEPGPGGVKKQVGQTIAFKTVKSKVSSPGQVMSVDFYTQDSESGFTAGEFDVAKEMMALALYHGVVLRAGPYYSLAAAPDRRYRGKEELLDGIRGDRALQEEIRAAVLAVVGG
jgi:recombination protein RecA